MDILLKLQKVRDGYRIDKNHPAVLALVEAARKVRAIPLPMAGKKLVTDAGIFAKHLAIPTLCHGPDQSSAHADIEYVEIHELELTAKVYLQFIVEFGLLSE
ncbi:M20/M25/M40 family metallo-hydrolase [Paenibacillus sp. GCM10023250]|uniref:M20/M25/M40 family metallo-hydrolase n=1 Tax=Paenibacillus sp. GCM10023250 TaxID=3252648 RepID=UPI0036202F42